MDREAWRAAVHGVVVSRTRLSDLTALILANLHHCPYKNKSWGFPWWLTGEESACQCRRQGFEPWSRKIPHAEEQLSLFNTTTEPKSYKCGAHGPQLLRPMCPKSPCSTTREREAGEQQLESSPHSLQLERNCTARTKTQPSQK